MFENAKSKKGPMADDRLNGGGAAKERFGQDAEREWLALTSGDGKRKRRDRSGGFTRMADPDVTARKGDGRDIIIDGVWRRLV